MVTFLCNRFNFAALQFQWTQLAIDNTFLLTSTYLVFAMQVRYPSCLLSPLMSAVTG